MALSGQRTTWRSQHPRSSGRRASTSPSLRMSAPTRRSSTSRTARSTGSRTARRDRSAATAPISTRSSATGAGPARPSPRRTARSAPSRSAARRPETRSCADANRLARMLPPGTLCRVPMSDGPAQAGVTIGNRCGLAPSRDRPERRSQALAAVLPGRGAALPRRPALRREGHPSPQRGDRHRDGLAVPGTAYLAEALETLPCRARSAVSLDLLARHGRELVQSQRHVPLLRPRPPFPRDRGGHGRAVGGHRGSPPSARLVSPPSRTSRSRPRSTTRTCSSGRTTSAERPTSSTISQWASWRPPSTPACMHYGVHRRERAAHERQGMRLVAPFRGAQA
jgi:hypothetical protein